MLSIQNGKYYNLGAIGGRIWELMEQPVSVPAIVSRLVSEYDIESDVCEQQVRRFLGQMESEGLVR
ncbi:lasso peptide biosynthesis PqqD family chaperone [Paenibacillus thailandensis]|uniref:lasso peptide biosynthesis PqqD family chaperone n=1 Tax=Paenibacillus thailandensis TaxID=393250 RepID=UPI0036301DE6